MNFTAAVRWRFSALWLVVFAFVMMASATACAMTKPNIVLIMLDDAGYTEFGFTAAHHALTANRPSKTPNIDSLAAQSVFFPQAYVGAAVCSPSRAALFTGQEVSRFGYEDNITDTLTSTQGLQPGQLTLAEDLKGLGYRTGLVGKWHLGGSDNYNRPLDSGFDEFFGILGGGRQYYSGPAPNYQNMFRGDTDVETIWGMEGNPALYEPGEGKGRYVTDAWAEESVDFINRSAANSQPFFLMTSLTAPHTPWTAKTSDLAQFPNITDPEQKTIAAMNYAADRAVGMITNALQARGIANNTVVVFTNDNGAPVFGGEDQNNLPFSGNKGLFWEGGLRVPLTIKIPGVAPGVYNHAVTTRDLFPTLHALAGADPSTLDVDGVNLVPFLSNVGGQPHEVLIWRGPNGRFAVRKGEWKLTRVGEPTFARLHNIALNPAETTFYNLGGAFQSVVDDLNRELTYWEAQMVKPKWGAIGAEIYNTFDHFKFRNELAASTNWNAAGAWVRGGIASTTPVTMRGEDAYANAIIEFGTRNDASYTAANNMTRATLQTYMLNEMRLTGAFSGAAAQSGTINGNAVLFTQNLAGGGAKIRLDATATGGQRFGFFVDNQIQLLSDLEITGNGTQDFSIRGVIKDYFTPKNVTKTGTSVVTLSGNNTFAGALVIQQGEVKIAGASAAIRNATDVLIGGTGKLSLNSGLLATNRLLQFTGSDFDFTGGRLNANIVEGSLENVGGVFAPNLNLGPTTVVGNYSQTAASTLEFTLGGGLATGLYDSLNIKGSATLSGLLDVVLAPGYTPTFGSQFPVIRANSLSLSGFALTPADDAVFDLLLVQGGSYSQLVLRYTGNSASVIVKGDYNGDGQVNIADYTVWRDNFNAFGPAGILGDGDNGSGTGTPDGIVNLADYNYWRARFNAVSGSALANSAAVPEPTTAAITLIAVVSLMLKCRTISRSQEPRLKQR